VGSLKTISPKSTGYYAGWEGGGIGLGWFCSKTPNLNEKFRESLRRQRVQGATRESRESLGVRGVTRQSGESLRSPGSH